MKNRIGIWMDFRHADIFDMAGKEIKHRIVKSNISEKKVKGGSRSKTPWGPMDKVSESKMLNKKLASRKKYYQHLAQMVDGFEEVVILGPGAAKEEFNAYLIEECPRHPRVRAVKTVDSITINQKRAMLESMFDENLSDQSGTDSDQLGQ